MSPLYRDDAPEDFSLVRRRILVAGGLLLGGLASATAQTGPALAADNTVADFANQFMNLSSLLIQHRLDRDVGVRLAAALKAQSPDFAAHVGELLGIANTKNATIVEDFFYELPDGPLKDTALGIVSAWYIGVIVDEPNAEVFAYELALMFQPTIDVMTIPTYAISGPNGWTSAAPPLSNMPEF